MTTMGYGDIVPRTVTTKILLCIFGVVGTGFIALPAVCSCFKVQIITIPLHISATAISPQQVFQENSYVLYHQIVQNLSFALNNISIW